MCIDELLQKSIKVLKENNIEEASSKAKILLAFYLDVKKEYLIIHNRDNVDIKIENIFLEGIQKLINNVPLQYITNKQEFMRLNFYIDENVLIPRADTEILVEEVITICNKKDKVKVLDLCTGSGAIAISIAKYLKRCEVTAIDISDNALEVAIKNAKINNVEVDFRKLDILEEDIVLEDKFDIIVSNPPYIETDTIRNLSKDVQNEPQIALDGGQDGLTFYKRIIDIAYKYLNENGALCFEIGYNQKNAVQSLIKENKQYINIYSKKDLGGNDRIVICSKMEE